MDTGVQTARVDLPAPELVPIAAGLPEPDALRLNRAYELARSIYADKRLGTGEPALEHALGLAGSLAALRLDAETRIAGILFAAPQYLADSQDKLAADFGPAVAGLVAGIAKLNRLRVITRTLAGQESGAAHSSQAEVLRKMLLAMVEDIRVVLLRLASRTQTLRFMARASDELRRPYAQETLDIYAPLANRLGIWQLKWELEDYAFRYLEPEVYKKIASMLDEKREERERFIAGAVAALDAELRSTGIRAEVLGRPKHIYSIYNKMRGKSLDFSELYDVRALRVLVDSVKDCYTALGVVHNLWTPIPKEFDDYISRPKSNDYRSLHTAVIGPDGRALEVQIRTHEMHRHAELGVAAHWRYKEAGAGRAAARPDPFDEKIAWLRQVLAWRDDVAEAVDWVEQFKRTALDDTVYVLTPQGRVLDLPQGATPVDFAYHLHTDLGHHCRGAKVDGVMVPLNYKLANGQRVEIIAAKTGGPSRDWMNPATGLPAKFARAQQGAAMVQYPGAGRYRGPGTRHHRARTAARGHDRRQSGPPGAAARLQPERGAVRRGRARGNRTETAADCAARRGAAAAGAAPRSACRNGGARCTAAGQEPRRRQGRRHTRRRHGQADDAIGQVLPARAA